jgi:hypothetical protein
LDEVEKMESVPPQSHQPEIDHQPARRQGRARQRQLARQARRERTRSAPSDEAITSMVARPDLSGVAGFAGRIRSGLGGLLQDFSWQQITSRAPLLIVLIIGLVIVFSLGAVYASGRVFPGVTVGGVSVAGLSQLEAAASLQAAWAEQTLTLREGERTWDIPLVDLGYQLDAAASARLAVEYGRTEGGIGALIGTALSGAELVPVIELDVDRTRDALLNYASQVAVPPQNATVQLQGVVVTHLPAQPGKRLNINEFLPALMVDPISVVEAGVVDLPMLPVYPLITDASPLVEYAQALLQRPLTIEAYDPVADEAYPFVLQPEEWGQWLDTRLVHHETGPRMYLSVEALPVRNYLESRALELPEPLTLDFGDGVQAVQEAVATGALETWVTVRYLPTIHTVGRGETAYSIARTTGIPFYMIEQANPERDLSELFVGDQINLPSRDTMLPLRPIRNKRIVVDLSDQYLWAYENGRIVYEWSISSGISSAPTSAGVFQVLSHDEVAYGSSFTLCEDDEDSGTYSCGQWQMHWFMGIYEVVPGLVNGFHGAVELPDGRYLGGGQVGRPFTFGCIMSLEDNAIQLYEWAEDGVVVEIRQ